MFTLAGHAMSQDRNENWDNYMRECPRHLARMAGLRRVRTLTTITLLLLGLGALLVEYQPWQGHYTPPAGVMEALEKFYQIRN